MSHKEQRKVMEEYNQFRYQVVCCAELLTEGWDNTATSFVGIMKPTRNRFRYAQMVGRGLRRCDEIGKLDCLILDFDWRCDDSCRDLATPVDLYDDGDEEISAPVKNEANRILRDGGLSVADAIEEAEKRVRRRPIVDINLTGQRARYEIYRRDSKGVCTILGIKQLKNHDYDWRGNNPPTTGQKNYLAVLGVEDTSKLSKWGAAKLIGELKVRHDSGLASPRQVQDLLCLGVPEDLARGMKSAMAGRVIRQYGVVVDAGGKDPCLF
jgi:hypothetical protein